MPTEEAIAEAGRTLAKAARSPARVILFGSWARGDARPDSDLDFLVIERDGNGDGSFDEMIRLRDCLPPLGVPVDVIVMSADLVERRRKVPGTMVHAALREGRLIAESWSRELLSGEAQ